MEARCYLCHGPDPPLQQCARAPCAWAWHAACQRRVDLAGPLHAWQPVACPSGHAEPGGRQKRVRPQWSWWACRCRIGGCCECAGAACGTLCWWFGRLLVSAVALTFATYLVLVALDVDDDTAPPLLQAVIDLVVQLVVLLSVVAAARRFWARVVDCWRIRTVDYT